VRNKLYQGSSKTLYQVDEDFTLIMAFNDSHRLENGDVINIAGKGVINNNISAFLMNRLEMIGIENHLMEKVNMREQLIQFADILPFKLSISTVACGRYVTEFGIEEGYVFDGPIIDYRIKNSILNYPVTNEHQILSFGWLTKEEMTHLQTKSIRIFDFLAGLFIGLGLRLVECNLEFGKVFNGEESILMLTDEISLDNCRLWDIHTNEKLSFESAIKGVESASNAYQNVMQRFNVLTNDFN
jgi:phosphoribosylaminoimidazole-succinocarboxamide synthase